MPNGLMAYDMTLFGTPLNDPYRAESVRRPTLHPGSYAALPIRGDPPAPLFRGQAGRPNLGWIGWKLNPAASKVLLCALR